MLVATTLFMVDGKEYGLRDAATGASVAIRMKRRFAKTVIVSKRDFTTPFWMLPLPSYGTLRCSHHVIIAMLAATGQTNQAVKLGLAPSFDTAVLADLLQVIPYKS